MALLLLQTYNSMVSKVSNGAAKFSSLVSNLEFYSVILLIIITSTTIY